MENLIDKLQSKFSKEIKRYGIKRVFKEENTVTYESDELLPWELFESIKLELA